MTAVQPRWRILQMLIRGEYEPVKSAIEAAGFFVTEMPLDSGGDRIVCAGLRRAAGGYTGNNFWLAERKGDWFVGSWGGMLYRVADSTAASSLSVAWLQKDANRLESDI